MRRQTGEGIVRCRVFNKHMVVLATPELCKRVLQTNISNYVKGTALPSPTPYPVR